jgi:tRNA (cmo5U34)-methyltransferase
VSGDAAEKKPNRDNKTSQSAAQYDANVEKTIPRYSQFHLETLDLVGAVNPKPLLWLDTGCGTGNLAAKAADRFAGVRFILSDPSAAMLDIAREKLQGIEAEYVLSGSEALSPAGLVDVVTAIMSHHYLTAEQRRQATENCFAALKPGGVYVTFETIRPCSEAATAIGLQRWRQHQLNSGKPAEEVEKHISRYGVELLPITIEEHLQLLRQAGFSSVEILWASGLQAGFYALKG